MTGRELRMRRTGISGPPTPLQKYLRRLRACPEAIHWARDFDSPEEAVEACEVGSWLFWLVVILQKPDKDSMIARDTRAELESRMLMHDCWVPTSWVRKYDLDAYPEWAQKKAAKVIKEYIDFEGMIEEMRNGTTEDQADSP